MNTICDSNQCSHEVKKQVFIKHGFRIFDCNQCSIRFAEVTDLENHISNVYKDSYFFGGKAGYPNYLEEKDLLIASGKRYSEIVTKYIKSGNLLDVGCAAGFIMKGFENAGWQCDGIEPNETMANYGRNELLLNIMTSNLEQFNTLKKYDLICLIEVIGHFYDLNKAIQNVFNLLNEDGLVLIESWNMNSIIAKLFGKRWHEYSPPSVLHWFSDFTLAQLFGKIGLQLIASGFPQKQINVKHAISLLDEHMPNFPGKKELLKLTNQIAGKHSLTYPLNDLKWYLFKRQIKSN